MFYAGDVSAKECWVSLEMSTKSQLVDVRSSPEWQFIGVPDLTELAKETIFVQWQSPPHMQVNPSFVDEVITRLEAVGSKANDPVYMLCRSGVRSMSAAKTLTASGYTNVFNVADGFEGDADATGQRARLGGWQFEGLPWTS